MLYASRIPSSLNAVVDSATVPSGENVFGSSSTRPGSARSRVTYSTAWFCSPVLRKYAYSAPARSGTPQRS